MGNGQVDILQYWRIVESDKMIAEKSFREVLSLLLLRII